jgi:hypothetical protein
VLAIDGAVRGMEGDVARQFGRRWPTLWSEIESEVRYPVRLGKVYEVEVSSEHTDCPFKLVILASTLHHADTLGDGQKRGIVRTALANAIDTVESYRLSSCASTLMCGGWRLSQDGALRAMVEGFEQARSAEGTVSLAIYTKNEREYEVLRGLILSLGWH